MRQRLSLLMIFLISLTSLAHAQETKRKPDINESKEFPGVYHSPSAESTPRVFRSVLNMEIVVKEEGREAAVRYANGIVVTKDGLIACVLDQPGSQLTAEGIESATILLLDGGAANASLVVFDAPHGVALFRGEGLELPALNLSQSSLVAKRRLSWHAVFRDGRKTFLYSRPLQVHKAKITIGDVEDLCEIIDAGSSSLTADRSGSALLSLDGSLVALMGRQPHWNVSPKNVQPRTKVCWAVPATVIAELVEGARVEGALAN